MFLVEQWLGMFQTSCEVLESFLHQTHNSLFTIRDKKPKSVLSQVTEFCFFSLSFPYFLIFKVVTVCSEHQACHSLPVSYVPDHTLLVDRQQQTEALTLPSVIPDCNHGTQMQCRNSLACSFLQLVSTFFFFFFCYKPVKVLLKWKISPLRELWQSDEVPVWRVCAFSARKKWKVSRWRARHIKTSGSILFVFVCIFLFTPWQEAGISVFFNLWQNSWPLKGMFLNNLAIPQQQVPGFQALSLTSHPFILCTLQIQHVHWNFFLTLIILVIEQIMNTHPIQVQYN